MNHVLLTVEQDKIVQEVIEKVRKLGVQNPLGDYNDDNYPSPEIYIVKTPTDGIPAMSKTGYGTGSGTSEYFFEGDLPGSAECQVYKIDTDSGALVEVDGLTKTVYNINYTKIRGRTFVTINRDKYGVWIPDGIPPWILRGKPIVDILSGSFGEVYVYDGPFGLEVPTGSIIEEVHNETNCTIQANTMATIIYTEDNDQWQFLISRNV